VQTRATATRFVLAKIGRIACASENLPIRPRRNQVARTTSALGCDRRRFVEFFRQPDNPNMQVGPFITRAPERES
jgi:hypothetical protein